MKLIKRDVETVGGEFDMCKAFDDMMRDSKQEGIREGRRVGQNVRQKNKWNELIQKLVSAEGVTNDLLQASNNKSIEKTDGGVGNCKGKIGWQPWIAATQFNSRRITILWVNIVQPQYFHLLHCTSRAYMLLYSKNRNCI
ncbi:MAG: hypothetical protein ACLTER_10420 [Ruminococcus sp.]